jgi:hypothetical protein
VYKQGASQTNVLQVSDQNTPARPDTIAGNYSANQSGVSTTDSYSGLGTTTDNRNSTATSTDGLTVTNANSSFLYEDGTYAGGAYSLSSFSFTDTEVSTQTSLYTLVVTATESGPLGGNEVSAGSVLFNGTGTFTRGSTVTTNSVQTSTETFNLYEGGSYAGSFNLSSYNLSDQLQGGTSSTTAGTVSESYTGTNQSDGYTGSRLDTFSVQSSSAQSVTLSQRGQYTSGTFNLSSVVYQGSFTQGYTYTDTSARGEL